jgi:hypothetical protein
MARVFVGTINLLLAMDVEYEGGHERYKQQAGLPDPSG